MFTTARLLITSGTGFSVNAVLRALIESNFSGMRIFSRDEKKIDDMRKRYNFDKLKFYIGDISDYQSVLKALHGVDFIFRAAA